MWRIDFDYVVELTAGVSIRKIYAHLNDADVAKSPKLGLEFQIQKSDSIVMTVQEVKELAEAYREALKEQAGKITAFSETGPVGIGIIDSIVRVLEAQQNRIDELERKLQ